jgi:hypothetical protein
MAAVASQRMRRSANGGGRRRRARGVPGGDVARRLGKVIHSRLWLKISFSGGRGIGAGHYGSSGH